MVNLAGLGRHGLMVGTGAAVTLSALGVPAAWPFVGKMYIHQYDPQAFFDAATTWSSVHDDVGAQAVRGDGGGLHDLAAATFAQGPMLVWGTANRIERDLTAHGLSGRFPSSGPWSSSRAGSALPPGLPQAAGGKAVNDLTTGGRTLTGRFAPEQHTDGSYSFPWE
ncbi:hypothetical protein [Nonomuraea sp. NPDC052265]|uniref:hypothetical protein n=1 Tax=Nonomuraea sp. NPDC052265 TaxID=3364374 RepID=UPI0037C73A9E